MEKKYNKKECIRCKSIFEIWECTRSEHCKECRIIARKEKEKEHYLKHRENTLARERRRYEKNPERKKKYSSEYRIKNPEKIRKWKEENIEKIREKDRKWRNENKDKKRRYSREWSRKNPEKIKAQNQAKFHIKLKDKCETCNSVEKLERHHPDYSKPLEVITLCKKCHMKIHRRRKE